MKIFLKATEFFFQKIMINFRKITIYSVWILRSMLKYFRNFKSILISMFINFNN